MVMEDFERVQKAETDEQKLKVIEELVKTYRDSGLEGLRLEAKLPDPDNPSYEDYLKCNLAKTVSAFANSEGGIILWGCKDKTWKIKPIKQVVGLYNRLVELTRLCTVPEVKEARSIAVKTGKADEGIVATFVPKSDYGPHQANMGKSGEPGGDVVGRYYRRHVDACHPMRHYELEEMFGRRPHPIILPEVALAFSARRQVYVLSFDLWNRGVGIGKWCAMKIEFTPRDAPWEYKPSAELGALSRRSIRKRGKSYYSVHPVSADTEVGSIIHPDDHTLYCRFEMRENASKEHFGKQRTEEWRNCIRFVWRTAAEGMRWRLGEFDVTYQNLCAKETILIASWRETNDSGTKAKTLIPIRAEES